MRVDHFRHQQYIYKQLKNSTLKLENNYKPINISLNDMDKFEKRTSKEGNIYKKYMVRLVRLVN